MIKYIKDIIKKEYGFDVDHCSKEDLLKVTKIETSDVTGVGRSQVSYDWDYSEFPNLKTLDCSYNYIDTINIQQNTLLEEINWQGVRGNFTNPIDLSGNPHLKKIIAGQDGLTELDLSNNTELEDLRIFLNSSFRWINLDKCTKLRRIHLMGVNIPFVDLTHCPDLEFCDINYMNLYRNKNDVYGDGYPRPLVFVQDNFDENIIPENTRTQSFYTYYLIRTKSNSAEEQFLNYLKSNKRVFVSIAPDNYGREVAQMHYKLLDLLEEYRKNNSV